jgi:hypothetical protein
MVRCYGSDTTDRDSAVAMDSGGDAVVAGSSYNGTNYDYWTAVVSRLC